MIVEFNLKGYGRMSDARVDADVRKVDDLASLYLWQEAGWHYAPNITRLMPDHEHVFLGGSTAISLDPDLWRIVSRQRRPLHYGVPGVCDRRWITEVIATRNGATVAIGSGHWAPKRGGLGIPAQRRGNANAKAWIARHVAAGRPGILGFDANQKIRFLGEEIGGQRLRYVRDPSDPIIGFVLWGSETHGWSTGSVPRGIDGVNSDHRPWLGDFDLFRKKATVSDARLARPSWRGRTNVDAMTIACVEHAERIGGHQFVITQGSYQSSVSASAGTHDRGGAVDLRWCGHDRCIRALRQAGMAAWHRTPSQGPWPHHVHAVVIGHPDLSPSAARQITSYLDGRNGLANNGPDDGPRLNPIPRPVWPPTEEEWSDMATEAEFRKVVREEFAAIIRDDDSIGRARVEEPSGKGVWTLAQLLWHIKGQLEQLVKKAGA